MVTITTDSQMAYLFDRVNQLEALVRHHEGKEQDLRELIGQLQDRCDTFSDAMVEALHGKTLDETHEQAFDRVMELLRATNVDTH
jgi:hypothetical protein